MGYYMLYKPYKYIYIYQPYLGRIYSPNSVTTKYLKFSVLPPATCIFNNIDLYIIIYVPGQQTDGNVYIPGQQTDGNVYVPGQQTNGFYPISDMYGTLCISTYKSVSSNLHHTYITIIMSGQHSAYNLI